MFNMIYLVSGLIIGFLCLYASRADQNTNNTIFGDLAWILCAIGGYLGYFGSAITLWLIYEDKLFAFFPWGLGLILLSGGYAGGWFSDSDYKKMRREEALEAAKRPHETTIVDYVVWILIAIAVWYFFF